MEAKTLDRIRSYSRYLRIGHFANEINCMKQMLMI